jgi:hypothetical protein
MSLDIDALVEEDTEELVEEVPAEPDRGDEPEPTEAPTPAPAPAPARDTKGKFAGIPKARFDEAVGKERTARAAAESRVADLQRQLNERGAQVTQSQQIGEAEERVAALEQQHSEYLLDGEGTKATAAMREIRQIERQIAKAEMRSEASAMTQTSLESERIELAIAQLEAAHPILNPASDSFDETLVNFVLSEQQRLMKSEGLTASKAILKAASAVVERYGPKEATTPAKGLGSATTDRKAAAVQKNLGVKQPNNTKDVGLDSDKLGQNAPTPDVSQMTGEEFAALPASMKAKMRGDFL